MSPDDQLAAIRAAVDQAIASAHPAPGRATVSVGAAEWDAVLTAAGSLPPGSARVPTGEARGLTLAELAELEHAGEWLAWAAARQWPPAFRVALDAFLEIRTGTW